jgi:hypothetical protein
MQDRLKDQRAHVRTKVISEEKVIGGSAIAFRCMEGKATSYLELGEQ